jgi:hypothetical protein
VPLSAAKEIPYECPNCSPRKTNKCFYNTGKGCWHCFRCNATGRVGRLGEPHTLGTMPRESPTLSVPITHPLSSLGRRYLLDRGIARHLIDNLPIFSTDTGILFSFPEWGYWQERNWTTSGKPRWMGPSSPRASEGVSYRLAGPTRRLVLVEGVGDALKVASAGFSTAAMLSKRLHPAQAARLADSHEHATLLLDRDVQLSELLGTLNIAREFFSSVRIAKLPGYTYQDPGEMPIPLLREVLS